mmetsp:Transcript_24099/g.64648  ORF Transcript_24099/g.64648 Transcript_24099/m.64648 type:complete len:234 (-) Transcript_24099:156-857(-)
MHRVASDTSYEPKELEEGCGARGGPAGGRPARPARCESAERDQSARTAALRPEARRPRAPLRRRRVVAPRAGGVPHRRPAPQPVPCFLMSPLAASSFSMRKLAIASRWSPENCMTWPMSSSSTMVPLHECAFLIALTIFFISSSWLRPCTVVMHLRPLRCCTRMWMRSLAGAASSGSSASTANGSFAFPRLSKSIHCLNYSMPAGERWACAHVGASPDRAELLAGAGRGGCGT